MMDNPVSNNVRQVAAMFPDVEEDEIRRDLEMTQSLETTINNILDGSVTLCSQEDNTANSAASGPFADLSEDELPDLDEVHDPPTNTISKLGKSTSVRSDFISDSSDVEIEPPALAGRQRQTAVINVDSDDDDNNVGLLGRIKQKTSRDRPCAAISVRSDFYSDGSDLEEDFGRGPAMACSSRPLDTAQHSGLGIGSRGPSSFRTVIGDEDWNTEPAMDSAAPYQDWNPEPKRKRRKSEGARADAKKQAEEKKVEREAERQRKREAVEALKRTKLEVKQRKELERQQKKDEKEYEKTKKKTLQEVQRSAKPGECLKHVTVMLDPGVLKYPGGGAILGLIEASDLKYDIQPQVFPNIVTFWREVTDVKEVAPRKLETETKEIVEDQILLFLPILQFIELVFTYQQSKKGLHQLNTDTLTSYVAQLRSKLENRKVTLLINGMNKYFSDQRNRDQRAYRENVLSVDRPGAPEPSGGRKKKVGGTGLHVSRMDVEEALIDVQLQTGTNIRLLDSDKDVSTSVMQYAKAVAETPFKKGRMECGFSFHIESSGCVKVDKDGQGLSKVWRKQLQQFKNITAEVANAILAVYPSPCSLWKAYDECSSDRQAELLLQDIVVRRGAGVMATARRIGKEMSRRIWQLMTSQDPNTVLR